MCPLMMLATQLRQDATDTITGLSYKMHVLQQEIGINLSSFIFTASCDVMHDVKITEEEC